MPVIPTSPLILNVPSSCWGAWGSIMVKVYATSRKVAGSGPDEVNYIYQFT
jgi:hypothetical protein